MKTTMLAAVKGLALGVAVMTLSCNAADKKAGSGGSNDQAFRFNPPVGAAYDITMQMDMDQKVMGQNNKIGLSTT